MNWQTLVCLLAALTATPGITKDTGDNRPTVHIVPCAGEQASVTKLTVARLQEYGGFKVQAAQTADRATNSLTILLGSAKDSPELQRQWAAHTSAKPDSYLIRTVSTNPISIAASGIDPRGTLYAGYQLADLLKAKADLSALDIFRQPKIAERYVCFGATTHGRRKYDPQRYWKTLNELPAFGYNGVIIYPGGGTPIGRHSSPVVEAADGKLRLDPENTRQWKAWFAEIQKYQLDIMMTIPPVVPPGYAHKAIHDYYAGGPEPTGYLPALQSHFRRYLELLASAYPEVDRYMFNSTEGATFGHNVRFFGRPAPKRFSNVAYLRNNERVMRAYFDVLTEFFKSNLDRVGFWTHSYGLTSEGIAKMREVLFQYPRVTIIEDDFWNNNLWPFDLPAMAYLPPDLRAKVSTHNPFAMFQIATDGEYYGGGSLPNAYPGSHIRSAQNALSRNACMVIQRLDLHDRTPYGTALGTMKIVPYAASQQLWAPTPAEPAIWQEWAESRFGRPAAPFVIRALQESHGVILNGLSCNGLNLLAGASEFASGAWMKGGSIFRLFGKPGQRLVNKGQHDVIFSAEYTAFEMDTHSIPMDEFRRNQARAQLAVRRGLEQIEMARPYLAERDYEMLHDVFVNGDRVLRAIRLLGEAAHAANLLLDNFDQVERPRRLLENATAEMKDFLREGTLTPEMTANLTKIVESYEEIASQ